MSQNQETKETRLLKHNAYISAPMSVTESFKEEVRERVMELFEDHYDEHPYNLINVGYWRAGTPYNDTVYRKKIQHEIDIFILIFPMNSFKIDIGSLSSGARKEYLLAKEANRDIYLAYETKDGEIGIYDLRQVGSMLEGVAGTKNQIFQTINKNGQIMENDKGPKKSFPVASLEKFVPVDKESYKAFMSSVNSQYLSSSRDLRLLLLI